MAENLNSRFEMDQFLLESVINTMPIFIYWKDVNLIYLGCNKHYATINGFEKTSEVIGKTDENLLWAKYRFEQIEISDRRVVKNNVPEYNIIESWILPNGNEVMYNTNRIPIRKSDGNVGGILTTYEDITEKIFLERSLKESEENFRGITELLPETLFEANLQSFITYANPAGLEKFGFTQEDIDRGMNAFEFFVREKEREHAINNMKKILLGDDIGPNEYLFKKKDGTEFYGLIHSRPTYKDDIVSGIRGIIIDIDESKKAQLLIKSEKKKLEYILDSIIDGLCVNDVDGTITQVNKPFFEMFGLKSQNEILGKDIFEYIPEGEVSRITERFMDTINKKEPFIKNFDVICYRKDKTEFPVMFNIRNLWDNKGNYIGSISVARDITEFKKAEQKLRESEERFRALVETTSDWIWEVDHDAIYKYASPKVKDLLGYEPEEIIGKTPFDLMPPDEAKKVGEIFQSISQSRESFARLENTNIHKNGQYVVLETSGVPIFDEKGNFKGYRGIDRDITERKRSEQKLKESEERYKRLFKASRDAIMTLEPPKWRFTSGNPATLKMFKAKDELDFCSRAPWQYSPEKQPDGQLSNIKANEMIDKAMEKGSNFFEWTHKRIDGEDFPATVLLSRMEIGGKRFLQATVRDITERKIAEQKLKESEEKYRHLFNSTPYAIWLVDLKGKIIDCNNTMNQFMSIFKREDIIGKDFRDIIKMFLSKGDPRFANLEHTFRERFKLLLKQGYLEPIEFEISRGDGKTFWITLETSFVKVGKESFIQTFIKDITERKEAELKLKKSEEDLRVLNKELEQKVLERTKELQQSEEKFRTIFESIPDLFFLVDADSTIVDYRARKDDLYIPSKEFMSKKMSEIMPPDLGHEALEIIKKTIATQQPQIMEYSLSIKDKKQYFEARFLFFSEERVAIFVRNITERKIVEIELSESREKLKEQNIELTKLDKAKNDFITIAAHELKTPLISIAGYTDYILTTHKDDLPVDIKNDLKIVERNIDRLKNLMNQLFDVMKIESHKVDLNIKRNNISEIIYRCLHELSYLFKKKDHKVVLNIDNDIFLNIDPVRIFQAFSNLISNAVKFTPKGGNIEISAKKQENEYLFKVIDNGIGLSKNQLPLSFKKFETVQQEGKEDVQTGTGLGLYISKGFVKAHGGDMWAISEGLNKGMTINFTIPY